MNNDTWMLILLLAVVFGALVATTTFSGRGSLDSIKSKTVGDGQHGTARWATPAEVRKTFRFVPFQPALWRKGEQLPDAQGLVRKEGVAHGPGGFGRCPLPHDRCLRRGQDRLLPIPQFGIRLCQRHELLCQ